MLKELIIYLEEIRFFIPENTTWDLIVIRTPILYQYFFEYQALDEGHFYSFQLLLVWNGSSLLMPPLVQEFMGDRDNDQLSGA